MDLVQIFSEGDNTEERTVEWTRNPKTNSRSFSVRITFKLSKQEKKSVSLQVTSNGSLNFVTNN